MATIKTLSGLVIIIIVAGFLFIYSGIYNIAANDPHWKFTYLILTTTKERSISMRQNDNVAPHDIGADERYKRGARHYASKCEMCHLGPDINPTHLHQGLYPSPPKLAEMDLHHTHGYLFWTVKNGVKMTGMPAWEGTLTDDEIWDMVAFLVRLPYLTPQQYLQLTSSEHPS